LGLIITDKAGYKSTMSFTAETYDGANVLVLGGTGAQGLSVVKGMG
jgi:hypothetical protein